MFRSARFILLAALVPACSLMPPQSEHIRARQMEDAVVPMAATALEAGQLETARRLYRRLLVVDADSVQARMGLGDVAMREQETEAAARWYSSALVRAEEPAERHAALLAHGRAALAAGQLEAARTSFTRLADPAENASRSGAAWGHNGVGLTLLLEGDLRGGVAAMERAVLHAPEEERFRGNLDRALAILRDLPASRAPGEDSTASLGRPGTDRIEPDPPPAAPVSDTPPATETTTDVVVEGIVENTGEGASRDVVDHPPDKTTLPDETEPLPNGIENAPVEIAEIENAQKENAQIENIEIENAEIENFEIENAEIAIEIEEVVDTALPMDSAEGSTTRAAESTPTREDAPAIAETEAPPAISPPPPVQPHLPEPPVAGNLNSRTRAYVVTEDGTHFLQFGAFSERANAETLVAHITGLTEQRVRITDTETGAGARLHRVRVGPIASEQVLLETMATFEAGGYSMANPLQSSAPSAPEAGLEDGSTMAILVRAEGEQFLQAGAFAERSTAETVAGELRELTELPVRISVVDRADDPPLHRVRVGPIGSDDPLLARLKPED